MPDPGEDDVQQPLISSDPNKPPRASSSTDSHGRDVADADESALGTPGLFIWALTFSAGVSGLLFGYDTGVISSTLVSIGTDLSSQPLTTLAKSLLTSATALFALLASPASGLLADACGRKPIILFADLLFIAGAVGQALSSRVWQMVLGRAVVGIAVGSASFVVPLYVSELAPARWRGRLVTVVALLITGGQVGAYLVGWAFSHVPHGWRWMVGLGAVPAIVQVLTIAGMPETPRWLVKAGRLERARTVLRKVFGQDGEEVVKAVMTRVEREIEEEEDAAIAKTGRFEGAPDGFSVHLRRMKENFSELVTVPGHLRALTIACMLQGAQQLCGFNSLMYFSATIFALVGFKSPTLTSLCIAVTNFAFTLVAFHYIDRIGRRRILLLSIPVMVLGLALCALAFLFIHLPTQESRASTDPETGNPESSTPWPLAIVLSMVVYVASYAVGLGNVPWQQSELFPLSVRSLGSALATATNWGSNFVIGLTFLPMMDFVTPTGTFALYALLCVGAWMAVWKIYPETAGLGLEEVGSLLREGWGVEESLRTFRERRSKGIRAEPAQAEWD